MKPVQRAAKIRHTLQQLHSGYQVGFAGQPRLTRAAGQLDAWVTQIKTLSTQIKTLPPKLRDELNEVARSRIELYQKEAAAIRDAQQMNVFSQVAYGHIEWANLHSDRYQRHFAGQSRNTRDGSLLSELIVEAQAWLNQAEDHLKSAREELSESAKLDLTQRIERMRESEAMYQSELIAITQVQKEEGSSQERSGLHAYLANQCFATYRAHFAGQARTSRRLATLERLNAQLDVIAEQMDAIISSARDQDFDRDQAQKNREIVRDHLNSYREEERAIDQAQIALDYDGWVNVLRESGERIFEAYNQNFANKPRSGCDPELLCQLCDRLYDTALQLRPFVEYSPEPEERGQLLIMLDQLRLYQRELTLVREATGVSKA